MCVDFVEEYGDEIFNQLVQEMAPKRVCAELGLCSAKVAPKAILVGGTGTCSICENVIEYLDKLLEDDAIEESIDHMVEKACKYIPAGARDTVRLFLAPNYFEVPLSFQDFNDFFNF